MKIAFIAGSIPSAVFIERLILGLADHGVEIQLFGPVQKRVSYANKKIKVLGISSKIHQILLFVKYSFLLSAREPAEFFRFIRIIVNSNHRHTNRALVQYLGVLWNKPDILHIQWAKALEEWIWVRKFGIKLVLSLRGAHINYSPLSDRALANAYKTCFPHVDAFHAVSVAIGKVASNYGANPERIRVVYTGIELKQLPLKSKAKPATGKLKILSIGRAHWKKGYGYALDACSLLKERGIHFEYTIIGGMSEEYMFQTVQMGLSGYVILKPNQPFEHIVKYMQENDVLLLPSVEEGIANVVLEAMAVGLPVISTCCGGMSEVIEDRFNGYLVDVRQPSQITDALGQIAEMSLYDRANLVNRARATVEERFEQTRMASEMIELYKSIL